MLHALAQRLLGVGGLMSQVPADLTAVSSDGTVPVGALLGGIHNILTWRVSQHAGICAAHVFVFEMGFNTLVETPFQIFVQ